MKTRLSGDHEMSFVISEWELQEPQALKVVKLTEAGSEKGLGKPCSFSSVDWRETSVLLSASVANIVQDFSAGIVL